MNASLVKKGSVSIAVVTECKTVNAATQTKKRSYYKAIEKKVVKRCKMFCEHYIDSLWETCEQRDCDCNICSPALERLPNDFNGDFVKLMYQICKNDQRVMVDILRDETLNIYLFKYTCNYNGRFYTSEHSSKEVTKSRIAKDIIKGNYDCFAYTF